MSNVRRVEEPEISGRDPLDADCQRIALEQVASLVEQHYFDDSVGSECAALVRSVVIRPDGPAAAEFAERLTGVPNPHDRHFKVQWGEWRSKMLTTKVKREPRCRHLKR